MAKKDLERTKEELVVELKAMRRRLAALEGQIKREEAVEERLRHLNRVLRAIRNINQLIARGADRDQLIRGVCHNLVRDRGYSSAWVALLGEAGRPVVSAQAGLGRDFARLKRMLERGELPPCARKALEAGGTVVIQTGEGVCRGCPLEDKYSDITKMSVRLAYGGKVHGMITVSTFPGAAGGGEEGLLEEVAADIAFALHSLGLEEARRKAEEELRRSEERHRTVVESAAEGIFVAQDRKIVYANRRAVAMIGYTLEELKGMRIMGLFHPEDRAELLDRFGRWQRGEPSPRYPPLRLQAKDGKIRWVAPSVATITWEGRPALVSLLHDVTHQREAEEELRKSEERYRTLVDNSGEGILVVQDNRVVFANRRTLRTGGYSLEELQQMSVWDHFHPEDVEKAKRRLEGWLKGERQPRYYPLRVMLKNGSIRWLLFNAANINWDGKPALLVLMEDITEQKHLEDMLIESERRYRTVLEEAEDCYYETDLQGKLIFFSDALARQLGYSPAELLGLNFRQYVPEEEWENVFRTFNQVYRTGVPLRGFRAVQVTRDGRRITVEYSVLPRRNEKGEIVGFRGVCRDVTERREMEEAIRRSEERLRTALDEMEEGYFELDIAGNFTFVNDAMCHIMGYSREEIVGSNYRKLVAREDWERMFKVFNEVYRTGRPQKGIVFKAVHKDGSIGIGELNALPLWDEKGEIVGFRGIGRDITEPLKAEEERRGLERRAHLAARLASVGEMASGVAHEINNPLTGVIGYAQLLLARKDIPEDTKAALEVINESAQRVASILRRLLTFARQYKPERRLVNINEIVEAALRLRTYHLETSNITVTRQLDPKLPATVADPGQLQQVFLNIIINAEAAMKRLPKRGRLVVKTEAPGSVIRISFKDNGPGIAPEHLERIFEPFFTTAEVGEGTGLGLSVCHGIIAEHNGRIWAESQLGKGATFFIELPIETAMVEEKAVPARVPAHLGKAKILVVDDEAVVRDFVSQVLRAQGCDVDTAGSAAEAMEKIRSHDYQLMLLDIKIPGTSGIELYRKLKRLAPALARRTLFITGDVMGERTWEFLARTGAQYLVKPFDASSLVAAVTNALSKP